MEPIPATFEQFAAAARKCAAMGLIRCSSGNLSCRLDAQRMLVKASRAWMSELTEDEVALCRIADGASLNGKTPSVEIGLHAGVLRTRPDCNVVLHFQSPAATTLACRRDLGQIGFSVIPEIPYYVGPIGIVPYILPGTPELADAVVEAMRDHDLAVLASHGQVTVGNDFDEAIQRAVFFELACELIVRGGERIEPLPQDAIDQLRSASRRSRVKAV